MIFKIFENLKHMFLFPFGDIMNSNVGELKFEIRKRKLLFYSRINKLKNKVHLHMMKNDINIDSKTLECFDCAEPRS